MSFPISQRRLTSINFIGRTNHKLYIQQYPFIMASRPLTRPATQLLCNHTPALTRGHKTTARTKRSLKMAPHSSFQPSRTSPFPGATAIIYNPPASEASPDHTPFLFLPASDPRRFAIQRMRLQAGPSSAPSEGQLPPAMVHKGRLQKSHMTQADVQEMRRLREEDPLAWSVNALARKFDCSETFVKIAAPAGASHREWLQQKSERQQDRWGPIKTEARRQRQQRTEMVFRGEI